jgi:hypothetical protein
MSTLDSTHRSSPAVFVTDHLALASYLLSRGHEPTLSSTGSGKILFKFAASDDLAAEVDVFNDGHATVEPTAYDLARVTLCRQMDHLKAGAR